MFSWRRRSEKRAGVDKVILCVWECEMAVVCWRERREERERVVREDKVKLQGDPTTNCVSEMPPLKASSSVIDLFWFGLFKSIEF